MELGPLDFKPLQVSTRGSGEIFPSTVDDDRAA
jgi:hypothetical protein